VRSLPPSDRRLVFWLYADVDKYRGFLHEACAVNCPDFVVVFKDDAIKDTSQGKYIEGMDAHGKKNSAKRALVKMPGDAPWRSEELADHFVQFLNMVKVKAGGVEALTASADTFEEKERQLSQIGDDDEEEVGLHRLCHPRHQPCSNAVFLDLNAAV